MGLPPVVVGLGVYLLLSRSGVLGPLNLLVPLINFGLGWLLYDEPVPLDRLIGFAVVWAALLVVMWDRVATHRRQLVPEPIA